MAESNHSSAPEGFKEIPGYDGRYFINKEGLVWSCYRNRILTQHFDAAKRYLQSLLMRPDRKAGIPRYIHKLVASVWLDPPPGEIGVRRGQYCLNHKDGNKLNNHVDNLEWVTVEENTKHAWRNGLNLQVGETSSSSTLSSAQVREIRLRLVTGESAYKIAEDYGVGKNCVEKLRMYANWKHQDHDLVEPMMLISNSITLRKFHEKLMTEELASVAYSPVEQVAPSGVVVEMREFKRLKSKEQRKTRYPVQDPLVGWYYSI